PQQSVAQEKKAEANGNERNERTQNQRLSLLPPRSSRQDCSRLAFPLNLRRNLRITQAIVVKIYHPNTDAVFDRHFAQFMQVWAPAFVVFQILRHMFAQENVTGIAAIHHPLRNVDS